MSLISSNINENCMGLQGLKLNPSKFRLRLAGGCLLSYRGCAVIRGVKVEDVVLHVCDFVGETNSCSGE